MPVIEVGVYRAKGCATDLSITTFDEMPESKAKLEAALAEGMTVFRRQAKEIADALYATLPGGTLDQLLREMLERKASNFIVRF